MNLPYINPIAWSLKTLLRWWAATFGADVFVSYARSDGRSVARNVRDVLSRRLLVFLDEDLDHGTRFAPRLERELRRARMLVVILTPGALESDWVRRECEYHRTQRRGRARFVPVFVSPVHPKHLPASWAWIAEWNGEMVQPIVDSVSTADAVPPMYEVQQMTERFLQGPRRLTLARATIALVGLLSLVIPATALRAARVSDTRSAYLQQAASAESELHFAEAATELAKAGASGLGVDDLSRRLADDVKRAFLRPLAIVELESDWRVLAVGSHGDEPRFVFHDSGFDSSDRARIGISGPHAWSTVVSAPGEAQPQCVVTRDLVFLLAAGTLHRIPLDGAPARSVSVDVTRSMIVGGLDCTEMSFHDGRLVLLDRARAKSNHRVMVFDPDTLAEVGRHVISDEPDSETMIVLSRRKGRLAVLLRRTIATSGVDLTASALSVDGTIREIKNFAPDLRRQHVASLFTLYAMTLAPNDDQIFVALHELNLAGSPASSGGIHWIALDPNFPRRELVLEPDIDTLRPTSALSAFEAAYRRDSGELRALAFRSLVVLDRPGVTIAARSTAWTLAATPPMGRSFRAFIATRDDLVVYDDDEPSLRVRWREQLQAHGVAASQDHEPIALVGSLDGRFLVLELAAGEHPTRTIVVWRVDSAFSEDLRADPTRLQHALLEWARVRLPSAPASR